MNTTNYHGIIFNISQRDKFIFNGLNIIDKREAFPGIINFYKIEVLPENLNSVINRRQSNMANRFIHLKEFYFHFYRNNDLIIVFRNKIFRLTTELSSWTGAIEYGKCLGIPEKQLDFFPNKFEDKKF